MREKSVSLCERHCQQVSTMHGWVSSGTITQRTKANLPPSGSYSSLLNSPVFFSSSSQRRSACALVSGTRVS
jgi:hypothetical protein